MLAPPLVFPINNFFPYNWNKPTFASSCSKLLLNIWVTLSNETVRGSMKFSNSSSSSPTGKETKTKQQKHHIILRLFFGRVSLLGLYRKISLTSWELSYDLRKTWGLTYFYWAINKEDKLLIANNLYLRLACLCISHLSLFHISVFSVNLTAFV